MPLREYRPVDIDDQSSDSDINCEYAVLQKVWSKSNPSSHQCIRYQDYIIVKGNLIESCNIVAIKSPVKIKDMVKEFPEEIRLTLEKLIKDLDLNNTQLRKILQLYRKASRENSGLKQKIELLGNLARQKNSSDRKDKFMDKYRRCYSNFNECINSELFSLESEQKEEVKNTFDDLINVINDYKQKL